MKRAPIIVFAMVALAACEAPTQPTPDLVPEPSLTKMPPASGVALADGRFTASVFYAGIEGPDGLAVKTNSQLFVVKEYRTDKGVYLAKKGRSYSLSDAFSTLDAPFVSPDDIVVGPDGTLYVADGQAQAVFKISRHGGAPQPWVTTATTRGGFNPFGLAIAPAGFDGPNVDPGDIVVMDNDYGGPERAVWAVNPATGVARVVAEGAVFNDGPVSGAFARDGTLYVAENTFSGTFRIVSVSADGVVSPIYVDTGDRSALAINPLTDEFFFVKDDGEVLRMKLGGPATLFASGLGGTQDITFNDAGTILYVSSRTLQQVVQIQAVRAVWWK